MLAAGDQGQELRDMQRFIRFVKRQQAIERESRPDGLYTLWETWKFNRRTLTSTPSIASLNTIYKAAHEEVRASRDLKAWL